MRRLFLSLMLRSLPNPFSERDRRRIETSDRWAHRRRHALAQNRMSAKSRSAERPAKPSATHRASGQTGRALVAGIRNSFLRFGNKSDRADNETRTHHGQRIRTAPGLMIAALVRD